MQKCPKDGYIMIRTVADANTHDERFWDCLRCVECDYRECQWHEPISGYKGGELI